MNMSMRNITLRGLLFAAIVSLTACGGGAGTTGNPIQQAPPSTNNATTGTVGIFITDAASDRFDKILVQVTQVALLGTYSKVRSYVDDIVLVDVDTDGETILEEIHPKIPANGKIELKPPWSAFGRGR